MIKNQITHFAFFLILIPFISHAQTKNTYQFGYGKPFLEFINPNSPSHNFFVQYKRRINSPSNTTFFWSVRAEFLTEEDKLQNISSTNTNFSILSEGGFPFEGLVNTDETNPGFKQLQTIDAFRNQFKVHPLGGIQVTKPEKKFGLDLMFGLGISYEKIYGFYSGNIVSAVDTALPNVSNGVMYFGSYQRGFEFFGGGGFQTYFRLKKHYLIGFDAFVEFYFSGGLSITHNLFIAKEF